MRRLAAVVLLAIVPLSAVTASASKPIPIQELVQILASAHEKPDGRLADQISSIQLTERISSAQFTRLAAELPGPQSRQALVALADDSAFLSLPAAEIPIAPAPDAATQRQIIGLVAQYTIRTISKLPNFYATRITTRFEDPPGNSPTGPGASLMHHGPLQGAGTSSVTVLFREGHEVARTAKDKAAKSAAHDLSSQGEFGPVLYTVVKDLARGEMTWSHWESAQPRPLAVFRYAIPQTASHYQVASGEDSDPQSPPYHGEIAVNPADGTILRLTLVAELKEDALVSRAELAVEYAPVEIGGDLYTCPIRSIALSRVRVTTSVSPFAQRARTILGPAQTRVNDVRFENYHQFRSESRLLVGDGSEGDGKTP